MLVVSNEAGNSKAGRFPATAKGHGNLSNKQKKATLKIWQTTHHPHTLMSWSKTGSLLRPDAGSQGPKRSIPDALQKHTHPTFTHAYHSHERLSPSNEPNMLAGEPAGFRLTMTRSRFLERSGPFCAEFACFHRCPPAAFLFAVQRLIGDSEFPRIVVSCECECWDERPPWPDQNNTSDGGWTSASCYLLWMNWLFFFLLFWFVFRILFCFSWVTLL